MGRRHRSPAAVATDRGIDRALAHGAFFFGGDKRIVRTAEGEVVARYADLPPLPKVTLGGGTARREALEVARREAAARAKG